MWGSKRHVGPPQQLQEKRGVWKALMAIRPLVLESRETTKIE